MATKLESAGSRDSGGSHSDEVKLWRAQENMQNLYKIVTRLYNTPFKLKWACTMVYAENSQLKKQLKRIDDYTSGRILKPDTSNEYYHDPYEDPIFINDLINDILLQANMGANSLDGASRVAARDYMEKEMKFEYDILHPHLFIEWSGEGRLCVDTGMKDSGKSDWCIRKVEQFIAEGYRVFGNIEMQYDVPGYEYCSKFTKLIVKICESKLTGRPSEMVLDEAGLDLPSYEGSTRAWKEWDKFMKLTRKFRNNLDFIIQEVTQVPHVFRKNYSAWHHKYSRTVLRYELRAGPHAYKDFLVSDIPKTTLPFETEHIAGMDVDIEIREILDYLDDLPPRANQFEEMMNYVTRKLDKESIDLTNREKRAVALKLAAYKDKNPNVKLPDTLIAKALDIGESTIRKYKAEARKSGLLDDLVANEK